ncbi:AI-2E family transporter [Candidatus Epulonipiscium viviparus]|uniref:AI-2E family transporter n=1 Tax=Candidatus Epulonipiscium viviparus TaxID=420336 RepID=UPI000495691E|nr:AI-2E family transporter [Candidatus Epulopiscium viviparus]
MKIERRHKYYTICVYVVISIVITILISICMIKFIPIMGWLHWLFDRTVDLLSPLLIGLVLAYLMEPVVDLYISSLSRPHLSASRVRGISTFFAILTIVAIIGLFVLMIIMNMQQVIHKTDIKGLSQTINAYISYFQATAETLVNQLATDEMSMKAREILTTIYTTINSWATMFGQISMTWVADIGKNLIDIVFGVILAIYIMKDKPKLVKIVNNILSVIFTPKWYKRVTSIGRDLNSVLTGYVRGQILDALIMAVLVGIGLSLIKLDFAVIIGVVSGVFNIIPYFGPVVGLLLAGILGAIGGGIQQAIYAMLIVFVLQQIDGFIIVPKILGTNVKLHPIVVLLAILIGGDLFGLLGMLLGVPLCALMRVIIIRCVGNVFSESFAKSEND